MKAEPAIGEIFDVPHPFVRDTYSAWQEDEEGPYTTDVPTWRPGTRVENRHSPIWTGEDVPDPTDVADSMGAQVLTVVGVYKPGRFPVRVFYERQWRDPDGRIFGKTKCRMTTVPAFRRIVAGYRVPFEIVESRCSASRNGHAADLGTDPSRNGADGIERGLTNDAAMTSQDSQP